MKKNKKHEPRRLAHALRLLEKQHDKLRANAVSQKEKARIKRVAKADERLIRKLYKDGMIDAILPSI